MGLLMRLTTRTSLTWSLTLSYLGRRTSFQTTTWLAPDLAGFRACVFVLAERLLAGLSNKRSERGGSDPKSLLFRLRETPLPSPSSIVEGWEPLDGKAVGSDKFLMLNSTDFEALTHFFQIKINNGGQIFGRFSIGSTVLIAELSKKTVPTPFFNDDPQRRDPIRSGSLLFGDKAQQTGPSLGVCQLVGPLCQEQEVALRDPEASLWQ